MLRYTTDLLNNLNEEPVDEQWVIAGDTDSVTGDTIIEIDGKKMPIEKAFTTLRRTNGLSKKWNRGQSLSKIDEND